jgi:arginine decarboxylase
MHARTSALRPGTTAGGAPRQLDHSQAPVLDALADYKRTQRGRNFSPPGHKQGAGVDPRVREVLGQEVFSSDVLAMSGASGSRRTGRG